MKDVTLQVAAAAPLYVKRDEVPESVLATEKDVAGAQIQGKPAAVVEKIIAGKVDKYYSTRLPARAGLREGQYEDDQRPARRQDLRTGREHRDPPLHPLPGGRGAGGPAGSVSPQASIVSLKGPTRVGPFCLDHRRLSLKPSASAFSLKLESYFKP